MRMKKPDLYKTCTGILMPGLVDSCRRPNRTRCGTQSVPICTQRACLGRSSWTGLRAGGQAEFKGQWIDARGKFARAPNVSTLPKLKGKSVGNVADILRARGYTRTNPANPKNQRWVHPDGSEVQIHAYGNVNAGPYKAGNNAHAHKSLGRHGEPGTTELADDGMTAVNTHSAAAHIGMRNPANFPAVAGRPHGT